MDKSTSSVGKFRNTAILVIVPVALLALGVGVYFGRMPRANAFFGYVESVEGNVIRMNGTYMVDGKAFGAPAEVRVVVTPQTAFAATVLQAPSAEERNPNGSWNMDSLKREEATGSLAEIAGLGGQITLTAEAAANAYGKPEFKASKVSYTVLRFPESQVETEICEDANGKFIGTEACQAKVRDQEKQKTTAP